MTAMRGHLRAFLEPRENHVDMHISALQVRVTRMLGIAARRLEEGNLRQRSLVDCRQELLFVLEVSGAIWRARGETRVVIERLVVRLDIGLSAPRRVDYGGGSLSDLACRRLAPNSSRPRTNPNSRPSLTACRRWFSPSVAARDIAPLSA